MRFRYFNIALPALLALAACSDDDGLTSGNGQGEVRITTHISGAQTRAPQLGIDGSGNFEKGDALNLVVYGKEATPYTPDYLVETTTLYWEDIKNATGLNGFYTFAGWYSEDKTLKLQDNNSFSFNVAEAATDEQKDLLLATPTQVNEGDPVNIIFRHAMHKLVVNLSYGEGFDNVDKSAITVKPVGMNAAATIDVKAGTVTVGEASATKGDYDAKTLSNNSCSFILAPQKLQAGAEWLQIQVTEGQTISFHVPEQIVDGNTGTAVSLTQLNSGETLTLNLTIKRTNINDIAIELTGCTISDWTPGANYDENVAFPDSGVKVYVNLAELAEEYVINDDECYVFSGSGSYGIKVTGGIPDINLENAQISVSSGHAIDIQGGNPEIYLENAQISVESGNAIDIQGGNPTIHVRGENTIGTGSSLTNYAAGIYVAQGSSVTIEGSGTSDVLRVTGGADGAAIGGYSTDENSHNPCGDITINNVTLYAYASYSCMFNPPIGIGNNGTAACGKIEITDAIVHAWGYGTPYECTPAIGAYSGVPQIVISGSTIHAHRGTFNNFCFADYIGRGGNIREYQGGQIQCGSGSITGSTVYKYSYDGMTGSSSSDGSVVYDANGNATVR